MNIPPGHAPSHADSAGGGYRIVAATGMDRGDRDYQQDQLALLAHPRDGGCVLGVVADGMGGRSGGRKAADQVMLTARQVFARYHSADDDPQAFLARLAQEAHMMIRITAVAAEQEPHSTIAAFLLNPRGDCHWVHSGDSRIYHFRGDALQWRTRDHSWVESLVESGELTPDQARQDPRSNVLMSCLGAEEEPVLAHHSTGTLLAGDTLLACSDGLWHYFTDQELARVLHRLAPREACEFLVARARQRAAGIGDNLSLIVLKLLPLDSA
ncbi:MAG: hypothetical protein RJA36_1188 [Pseudomonadota bacterium]|jgi:serine/threonine protein phosphatase PrpC